MAKSNSDSKLPPTVFSRGSSFAQTLVMQKIRKNKLLNKLKNRNNLLIDSIDPELAALTVKNYILPMVTESNRVILQKDRQEKFVTGDRDVFQVTLSHALYEDLEKTKDDVAQYQDQLFKTLADCQKMKAELLELQKQKIQSEIELSVMKIEEGAIERDLSHYQNQYDQKGLEMPKLADRFGNAKQSWEKLLNSFAAEKGMSASLNAQAIRLDVKKSLRQIENALQGESLKGLYEAQEILTKPTADQHAYEEELGLHEYYGKQLKKDITSIEQQTSEHLRGHGQGVKTICNQAIELHNIAAATNRIRVRLPQQCKTQFNKIQENEQFNDEKKKQLQKAQKRSKDLYGLTSNLRKRTQELSKGFKMPQNIEHQCVNWNATYWENDNFNWSCCTHSSTYSGEQWWCCGNPDPHAKGCQQQKHVKRDEAEEEEEKKVAHYETNKCYSCKKYGHLTEQCPNDPNYRSQAANHRQERLNTLHMSVNSEEVDIEQANKLVRKQTSLDQFSKRLKKEEDFHPFDDIEILREEVNFESDLNFSRVEQIKSKQLDRENKIVTLCRQITGVKRKSLHSTGKNWYTLVHSASPTNMSMDHEVLETTMRSTRLDDFESSRLLI